jgi:hypothetical protein
MFSKVKEKVVGNNQGEFHKTTYKNLEKNEEVKQKIIGGNEGEFHKTAYENLFDSK